MKKISIFILVFILSITTSYAIDSSNHFIDVSSLDKYYEDIVKLSNEGIISGYADGTFKPNKYITNAEAISVIEKTLGKKDNLPEDWSWWTTQSKKIKGWTPSWDFSTNPFSNDYNQPATRNSIAYVLLKTENLPIVNPEPWYLKSDSEFDLYYLNLVLRGYWDHNGQASAKVTRAEFCNLLNWFISIRRDAIPYPLNKNIIDIKTDYKGVFDEREKISEYSEIYATVNKIPRNLQQYFVNKGFELHAVNETYWREVYPGLYNQNGTYFKNKNDKQIAVREYSLQTVSYEFGKFLLDTHPKYSDQIKRIYINDTSNLIMETSFRDVNDNYKDYFYRGFYEYLTNPEKLRANIPGLFNIYKDILAKI